MAAVILAIVLFTACRSSRESMTAQSSATHVEQDERLSVSQSLFMLFDSLAATQVFQADSLELEVFDAGLSSTQRTALPP